MVLTAPHLSRKLRALGFGITPDHRREGLRVRQGALPGRPSVSVQIDAPGVRRRVASDVMESLGQLGYRAQLDDDGDAAVITVWSPRAGE